MAKKMKKSAGQQKAQNVDMNAYMKKSTAGIIAAACLVIGFYLNTVVSGLMQPAPQQQVVQQMPAGQPQVDQKMSQRIQAQQAAVTNNPKDAEAWATLGHLYFDSNQPTEAIEAYTRSLELAPGSPDVLTDLGVMYRRSGQPKKALEAFNRAIAADGKHETARFNSGIVLMHDLNDLQGALAAWKGLLAINPEAQAPNGMHVHDLVDDLAMKLGAASGPTASPAPQGGPRLLPPGN